MAINPETQYPGKIAPSTPDYPYGAARNITNPGDGTGTPWEAALVNDLFGWQQALLDAAGVVPSGDPDKVGESQYLDALNKTRVLSSPTLAEAADRKDLKEGYVIATHGRSAAGDGGAAGYRVVLEASVTPDTFTVIQCTTVVTLALELIHDRRTLNLMKLGYDPTGSTPNDLVVNAAQRYMIDKFGGGELFYPAGVGLFERSIRLDNYDLATNSYVGSDENVRIKHTGASRRGTILRPALPINGLFSSFPEWGTPIPSYSGESERSGIGIEISNMTLDMDYNNIGDGGALYGANYDTYPTTFPDGSSPPSLHAADNFQYPVYAFRNKNVMVHNCDIRQSWYNGVEIFRTFEMKVFNCLIENCGDKANYLGDYSGIEVDNGSSDIDLFGNTILNCGQALFSNGGPIATNDRAVENLRFHNNVCKDIKNNGVDAFDWLDDWKIHSNTFERVGLDGVRIDFINPGASPNTDRHPKNISIYNNVFIRVNEDNAVGRDAIRCVGNGFSIYNNRIRQTRTSITNNTRAISVATGTATLAAGENTYSEVFNNSVMGRFQGDSDSVAMLNIAIDNTLVVDNVLKSADGVTQLAARIDADNVTYDGNKEIGTFLNASGKRPFILASGSSCEFYSTLYGVRVDAESTAGAGGLTGENAVNINEQVNTDVRGNVVGTTFTADYDGVYRCTGFIRLSTASSVNIAAFIQKGAANLGVVSRDVDGVDYMHVQVDVPLLAGQAIELKATSGGTYSIDSGSRLEVEQVRSKV